MVDASLLARDFPRQADQSEAAGFPVLALGLIALALLHIGLRFLLPEGYPLPGP